ncbi:MAG: PEGA domain-containing protein [bacterium]|nr:PEGA domain-containing protein [bacterium]
MTQSQTSTLARRLTEAAAFIILALLLWHFRSWNTGIGDGEFCCKQTIGAVAFPITLSRSFLTYALHRAMFQTLHPALHWWVEDIIALSSCAAGVVFFWMLYQLARHAARDRFEWFAILLFPASSLLLQVCCGHIEFYSWLCAALMASAYFAWRCIEYGESPLAASAAMALAGGFHSSGVFYFPALLTLPVLRRKDARFTRQDWARIAIFMGLYLITAVLHRKPGLWLPELFSPVTNFPVAVVLAAAAYLALTPQAVKDYLAPWWNVYLPWLGLYTLRATLNLRSEPLLEHIAPLGEPYDHGAYLYEFFSWDHLYDKTMFHLWIAPFGLALLILFLWRAPRRVLSDRWLHYLVHLCAWTMVWTIIFYPQLRTRDWDLFASMGIALNLFALFAVLKLAPRGLIRWAVPLGIAVHLCISLPVIYRNSSIGVDRGYATVSFESTPTGGRAYLRGLRLGDTPVSQPNIRTGMADVRVLSPVLGYGSWKEEIHLKNGESYHFAPVLPKVDLPPIPGEDDREADSGEEDAG